MAAKNDMNIQIDPEILEVIRRSTSVASQKGSAIGILKPKSKRRRTRAELEELKEIEQSKQDAEEALQQEVMSLKQQLDMAKMHIKDQEDSSYVLSQMMDAGVISKNKHGAYELVNHQK